MSFDTMGLSQAILRAVQEKGYKTPTSIQAQAIPIILQGKDVMGGAQTGTGKTAGFVLPIVHLISEKKGKRKAGSPRVLILTPTRELADQVYESVGAYGKYLHLKRCAVFGGVPMRAQITNLRKGVDILVATPGRLLDHVNRKTIDLSAVEILVLDEADRMLDMGFIHDIRKTIECMPKERQTLLFSATFSKEVQKLAETLLRNPEMIEVAQRNTVAETIQQSICLVDRKRKAELLTHLINKNNWNQVLVFTRTKHMADQLSQLLDESGIQATEIHGDKTQGARKRALAQFKNGHVRVLVATDVAARGLDIEQLSHVVNFELPTVASDYVHRIGRTGRAGNQGEALSLVCNDERRLLREIERLLKITFPTVTVPGFEVTAPARKQPVRKGPKKGFRPHSYPKRDASGTRKERTQDKRYEKQRYR